ncbi:hypothetical protein Adt_12038 [Abeliophyllum distichum]|uniref:Uncharacterized protein n=1 Tax=Abeliophyllum distichum TaxID=126358 RepID=A0ABD1UPN1_9LAMI
MGIPPTICSHPRNLFIMWVSNRHAKPGSLIAAVPLLIFWFLWNGRNNSKYNEEKLKATRIIKRINYMLESLLKAGVLTQPLENSLSLWQSLGGNQKTGGLILTPMEL